MDFKSKKGFAIKQYRYLKLILPQSREDAKKI